MLGTSGEQTKRGTMEPDGTGPHIHFELRSPDDKAINPKPELEGAEGSLSGSGSGVPVLVWLGVIAAAGLVLLVVFK
jgi:hypothetical protein